MNYKKYLILAMLLASFGAVCAQVKVENTKEGLFANPPDSLPKLFAQGIISIKDRIEYGVSISPSYNEIFFTAEGPEEGLMVMKKLKNGEWTNPAKANLRGNNSREFAAFHSPNGRLLFFSSPMKDTSRIWVSINKGEEWGNTVILDSPLNDQEVFWCTMSEKYNLFYTNGSAKKIFMTIMREGLFENGVDAGLPFGVHSYVAKDESFILFDHEGDIFVAFNGPGYKWGAPQKLGVNVNTKEFAESCPSLSPDGKYLFFSRYNDLNGKSDIYWASTSVIYSLKK